MDFALYILAPLVVGALVTILLLRSEVEGFVRRAEDAYRSNFDRAYRVGITTDVAYEWIKEARKIRKGLWLVRDRAQRQYLRQCLDHRINLCENILKAGIQTSFEIQSR